MNLYKCYDATELFGKILKDICKIGYKFIILVYKDSKFDQYQRVNL